MVLKLKLSSPVKFYGNSLPRPRIYTDVKFNNYRIDPPVPILDPLLSWAHEAHWSMGGLSFQRLRLQGRIEGSVGKLRVQREKIERKKKKVAKSTNGLALNQRRSKRAASDSPLPAPMVTKRRSLLDLVDEDEQIEENEEENVLKVVKRKRLVRKLAGEFDKMTVEAERSKSVSPSYCLKFRSHRSEGDETAETVMKVVEKVNTLNCKGKGLKGNKGKGKGKDNRLSGIVKGTRTFPKLANHT